MSRGFFGIGIWHTKTAANIGTLWRSATLYDAAFVAAVGARYRHQSGDTCHTPNHTPLYHYTDIDDLVQHLPHGCPLIGVELDPRATPLTEYRHPLRAMYLLGAEDHGLPPAVVDRCHDLITIPTARSFSHNVAVAGALVMHDRYTKTALPVEVSA